MKYLFIFLLVLVSCTPQFHINKAKKHTDKAIAKGAEMTSNDTTYINDTIVLTEILERGDTIFKTVTKTVEKVVTQKGEIRYITKKDKRKEFREDRKKAKRDFIIDKAIEKTKRVEKRIEKRSYWWLWLILGSIAGYILNKKFG